MGQSEIDEGLLDRRLTAEVRVAGVGAGVGDRYVHHPAHPRVGGGPEQHARLRHRRLVADVPVGETYPVGVDQGPGTAQRLGQGAGIGEVQRPDLDGGARGRAAGVAGERPDPAARRLQLAGDDRSGVAERSGHDVEVAGRGGVTGVQTRPPAR